MNSSSPGQGNAQLGSVFAFRRKSVLGRHTYSFGISDFASNRVRGYPDHWVYE